jgi:hypothetical protein
LYDGIVPGQEDNPLMYQRSAASKAIIQQESGD